MDPELAYALRQITQAPSSQELGKASPEQLREFAGAGSLDVETEMLKDQLRQAEALRAKGIQFTPHSTGIGAAMHGFGQLGGEAAGKVMNMFAKKDLKANALKSDDLAAKKMGFDQDQMLRKESALMNSEAGKNEAILSALRGMFSK
jgi:hypothetical protein